MSNSFQTLMPDSDAPSLHAKCDKPSGLGFNFMETKICNRCNLPKTLDRFGRKKIKNNIYTDCYCKDCHNKRLRENRQLKTYEIIDLPNERWVPIIDYEEHYLISTFFRVKSVYREVATGNTVTRKVAQLRTIDKNEDGYLQIILTKNKESKTLSLHILMAKAWGLPNPDKLPEVNHKDGNKSNCLLDNLEWSTHGDNMRHAVRNGLRKYKKVITPKKGILSEQDILYIYNSKERTGLLAKKYNLTKSSIQRIKSGKTYSKITKEGCPLKGAFHVLSKEDALFIKNSTISAKEIALKYKISDTLVFQIRNGKSYKWIGE